MFKTQIKKYTEINSNIEVSTMHFFYLFKNIYLQSLRQGIISKRGDIK